MTADEVEKYINQVAFSGAEEFLDKYKDSARFWNYWSRSWFLLCFYGRRK
jgi:hypothetical protein